MREQEGGSEEGGGWLKEKGRGKKKGGSDMVVEGVRREREGKWEREGVEVGDDFNLHVLCKATCMYGTCARELSVSSALVHV